MAATNSILASVISRATVAYSSRTAGVSSEPSASETSSGGGTSGFGPASVVNLSPAGQAAANQSSSGSGTSAPAPSGPPAGGGGIPVSTGSSSTEDTLELIEEADQQVIPKVGVQGASEVVDSQGNIDYTKLNQLILQQDTPKPNPLLNTSA